MLTRTISLSGIDLFLVRKRFESSMVMQRAPGSTITVCLPGLL